MANRKKQILLWWHIVVLLVCLCLITAGFVLRVDDIGAHFLGWKWSVHSLLDGASGGECAWCGLLRSFESAAKGHLTQASHHGGGIGILLLGLASWQGGYAAFAIHRWPRRMRKKARRINLYVLAAAVIACFLWQLR